MLNISHDKQFSKLSDFGKEWDCVEFFNRLSNCEQQKRANGAPKVTPDLLGDVGRWVANKLCDVTEKCAPVTEQVQEIAGKCNAVKAQVQEWTTGLKAKTMNLFKYCKKVTVDEDSKSSKRNSSQETGDKFNSTSPEKNIFYRFDVDAE